MCRVLLQKQAELKNTCEHSQRPSEPPLLWCVNLCVCPVWDRRTQTESEMETILSTEAGQVSCAAEDTSIRAYSSDQCSSSRINTTWAGSATKRMKLLLQKLLLECYKEDETTFREDSQEGEGRTVLFFYYLVKLTLNKVVVVMEH